MNEDHSVLILILMGDEAHFHVIGFVNIQNMHYCEPVNLEKCKDKQCIQEVSICCGVETFWIVGHFSLIMIMVKALQLVLSTL